MLDGGRDRLSRFAWSATGGRDWQVALSVIEQRYRAVMAVLDGASATEVAAGPAPRQRHRRDHRLPPTRLARPRPRRPHHHRPRLRNTRSRSSSTTKPAPSAAPPAGPSSSSRAAGHTGPGQRQRNSRATQGGQRSNPERRMLMVRRAFAKGRLKEYNKTAGSRRAAPLRSRVVQALERLAPGGRGGRLRTRAAGRVRRGTCSAAWTRYGRAGAARCSLIVAPSWYPRVVPRRPTPTGSQIEHEKSR
jgi:hypothetical protein